MCMMLFDVFSVTSLCERLFPGEGHALARRWRAKQLQYSLLRSLMGRYEDFWCVTGDGLVHAARSLNLHLTVATHARLMDAYTSLAMFPDVRAGLKDSKRMGLRLAILSNGAPAMLDLVTKNGGIDTLLDAVVSADDVRVFKPSPAVYLAAAKRLQVDVQALAFVSSNGWDVSGAASAGLTAFWIERDPENQPRSWDFRRAGSCGP